MNPLGRFLFGLPAAIPLLFMAMCMDFLLAPVSHKVKGDPPKDLADLAWKSLGI
jgi:hypothetical protein